MELELLLKRVQHANEFYRDYITDDVIGYGDFYFQDTNNPDYIVSAATYNRLKGEKMEAEFDESRLEAARSLEEYEEMLRQYTKNALETGIHKANFVHKKAY